MLLRTTPTLPALVNPEQTSRKLGSRWVGQGFPGATRETPRISVQDLQFKYGPEMARAPQLKEATFRVPLGTPQGTYERVRDQCIGQWLNVMVQKGWDACLDAQHRVQIYPGIYPAPDLQTGLFDLGAREFRVRAWFQFRNPKPMRIEIEPTLIRTTED